MKPEYSNFFAVRKNDINTEVAIDFAHTYQDIKLEVDAENNNILTKVEVKSDMISSLVLNMRDAVGLRDLLNKVIFEQEQK